MKYGGDGGNKMHVSSNLWDQEDSSGAHREDDQLLLENEILHDFDSEKSSTSWEQPDSETKGIKDRMGDESFEKFIKEIKDN